MCNGEGCSAKDSCHRHVANPSEFRQSYFMGTPGKDTSCEYYWPVIVQKPKQSKMPLKISTKIKGRQ